MTIVDSLILINWLFGALPAAITLFDFISPPSEHDWMI